jgi:uroporphyrinogen-III decarboxylase
MVLHTPRGDLTANYTENEGMRTVWRHDALMKSDEDVDRFLSAPFIPNPPDIERFERTRAALGERGVMEIEAPTPLCLVVENMPYEQFMVRALQDPARIEALLDKASELISRWLEGLLRAGFGPVFRFFGPEYAAPPMMSPKHFKQVVVERDRPLIELIHRHGGFVRYHCHGPIARILDDMLAMGVDMTDPCEPPPSGDIPLRELATRVGRDMILMGNIQLDAIERAEAEEIDRLVAEAIEEVEDRAPFILCTTAFPVTTPLPAVTERNLIQFLESAEKHGRGSRSDNA